MRPWWSIKVPRTSECLQTGAQKTGNWSLSVRKVPDILRAFSVVAKDLITTSYKFVHNYASMLCNPVYTYWSLSAGTCSSGCQLAVWHNGVAQLRQLQVMLLQLLVFVLWRHRITCAVMLYVAGVVVLMLHCARHLDGFCRFRLFATMSANKYTE